MDKKKVKRQILAELAKEDWDSSLICNWLTRMNTSVKKERMRRKISDVLPRIACDVCGTTVQKLMTGDRKRASVWAFKFLCKELVERHGYGYQEVADRFNRVDHGTVMWHIENLNGLLERDAPVINAYEQFRKEVDEITLSLSKGF